MKKSFGVFNYHTKELLGDFLSISDSGHGEIKVWFLSPDGELKYKHRENIYIAQRI